EAELKRAARELCERARQCSLSHIKLRGRACLNVWGDLGADRVRVSGRIDKVVRPVLDRLGEARNVEIAAGGYVEIGTHPGGLDVPAPVAADRSIHSPGASVGSAERLARGRYIAEAVENLRRQALRGIRIVRVELSICQPRRQHD